jgi:hypothetical protein
VRRKRHEMELSNAELMSMTSAMDDLHNDQSLPALREAVGEWQEAIREERAEQVAMGTSRRHFLLGTGGLLAGGAVLAACGTSSASPTTARPGSKATTSSPPGSSTSSAKSVAVDASIENLAIFAYTAGIKAATAGSLGKVPPAVPVFAETALAHHKAHLAAFNAVLSTAGLKAVTIPDPALTPTVKSAFAKVKTIPDLAELAVLLENTAAQSYQDDAATLGSLHARTTAASIMPVEMTHAAVLYYVLGKYPGVQDSSGKPQAFNPLTLARPDSDMSTT